jgi:PST family polysaccharide transporter
MIENFKSTMLFSLVQILVVLSKIILNKSAALFIGTDGFGIIGILQSTLEIIKVFFGFGVPQSATREIARNLDSQNELEITISSITQLSFILGSISCIFTYFFSDQLSKISFGDLDKAHLFEMLSIIVLFGIIADVQLGILRGMRKLKALALATVISAFVSVFMGVPTYYYFGYDGVISVFFAVALSALITSTYFLKKNHVKKNLNITTRKNIVKEYSSITKLGFLLMLIAFLALLSEYILKTYIANNFGLNIVGYYQVGLIVISGYFGIFSTAMMTDFYPKISNVHQDCKIIEKELNQQVLCSLLLIGPILVVFIFLMPNLIEILFSDKFTKSSEYIYLALFGTLVIIVSNPIDIILLVKDRVKLLFIISLLYRMLGVVTSIMFFNLYGLFGLGAAYLLMSILHLIIMQYYVSKLFGINLYAHTKKVFLVIFFVLAVAYLSIISAPENIITYMFQLIIVIFMLYYSNYYFKKITNFSLLELGRNRIKKNGK